MKALGRLRTLALIAVIAAATLALIRWADSLSLAFDISASGRNSLHDSTRRLLAAQAPPPSVTAVIPRGHPARIGIEQFFLPYQRARADLELRFVDPADDPDNARQRGLKLGDVVFESGPRRARATELTETAVVNALAQLARAEQRYITFLAGNGERQIVRAANHDLSDFAAGLSARGLALRELVLGDISSIPANTAVLVIASPRTAYAAGDLAAINAYVAAGGNLLWLADPDQPTAMSELARALGVIQLPGTVIDPVGLTKFNNPAYAVTTEHEDHPTLDGFQQTLVFPFAMALLPNPNIDWTAALLARTGSAAWNETGALEGNVGFDAEDEVRASHPLALALTRNTPAGGSQRVVVIGDGDFISNTFVANLGNREFGQRIVEWLAHDDALIDLDVSAIADAELDLQMWQRLLIFIVFGLGVPLSLLANGALYWWRQRHA